MLRGAGRARNVAYTKGWSADRGSSAVLPETALRGWLKQLHEKYTSTRYNGRGCYRQQTATHLESPVNNRQS
jgi:hypothetical protein